MTVAKRIIPCLDVDNGRVVKGVNFLNIRDAGDPSEVARRYDLEGADEITMLDITASHESRATTYQTVEKIASEVLQRPRAELLKYCMCTFGHKTPVGSSADQRAR
mgnify:CR=1 FL=1